MKVLDILVSTSLKYLRDPDNTVIEPGFEVKGDWGYSRVRFVST